MRNVSLVHCFGLGLVVAAVSCEPVDDHAKDRAKGWDGVTLTTVLQPGPREVFIDIEETMAVEDGCAKTTLDAHKILKDACAVCHDIGPASSGVPVFDFVLDEAQLVTKTWERQNQPAVRFLIPGDPENSAVYQRAVLSQNMPPIQGDPQAPFYPRLTYSQGSVLQEWINHCVPEPPTAAGAK